MNRSMRVLRLVSLSSLSLALACAGEEPQDIFDPRDGGEEVADVGFVDAGVERDGGTPRDAGPQRDAGPTTSFTADVQPIIQAYCVRCHSATNRPPRMDFRQPARNTYDRLVGRPALRAQANYIEPGDPDRSYLLLKIENRHQTITGFDGDFMPPNRERIRVSAPEVETLTTWIREGAVF